MNDRSCNDNKPSDAAIVRILVAYVEMLDGYFSDVNVSTDINRDAPDQLEQLARRIVEIAQRAKANDGNAS